MSGLVEMDPTLEKYNPQTSTCIHCAFVHDAVKGMQIWGQDNYMLLRAV